MRFWLPRRRGRAERIDANARALIRAFGADAYSEARQGKLQAESAKAAQEWRRIARVVAHKTGTRVGLDTASRMAMDADFTATRLVAEFSEVMSGRKDSRPELAKALSLCRIARALLVIARLDRLSRNIEMVARLRRAD